VPPRTVAGVAKLKFLELTVEGLVMPILFRGLSIETVQVDRVCNEIVRAGKLRADERSQPS
jgi:hypothetical protein